jgi:hypothetical protein
MEIVELLMGFGANPSLQNDLGHDVLYYCDTFPEIRSAIWRIQMETKQMNHEKSSFQSSRGDSKSNNTQNNTKVFTLQRRLSTAVLIKYDMYLISLPTMLSLFGTDVDRKKNMHLCHQDLLKQGLLTRFEDLPMGSFVMFVSHQWNGVNHPDPNGTHLRVLSKVLRNLRDGIYDVNTDPLHVLLHGSDTTISSSEWKVLLSNAYMWFDWFSQPQPSMESSTILKCQLQKNLDLAIESVASYVERADTLLVLAPSARHKDHIDALTKRNMFTCYRTWRRRGLCVLEFFCSFLSRRKMHLTMVIRSPITAPTFISSLESLKLSVGDSEFTCCKTNHLGPDGNTMRCSRRIAFDTLNTMITAKKNYLFEVNAVVHARWVTVTRQYLGTISLFDSHSLAYLLTHSPKPVRGLVQGETKQHNIKSLADLKQILCWNSKIDAEIEDRDKVSLLMYASCMNHVDAVRLTLERFKKEQNCQKLINALIQRQGYMYVGVPGLCTALTVAMSVASPDVVSVRLFFLSCIRLY